MDYLKSRDDLAKYFAEQGFNNGVEVGVASGLYSKVLCEANPNLKLSCVDLWGPGASRGEARYTREWKECQENLAPYEDRVTFIKGHSMDVVRDFAPKSIDFVYIDAAHTFDNVMRDIIEWAARVRTGGIISGHDFGNSRKNGVKDAVIMYSKWHDRPYHVLPEPDHIWTPRDPSDEIAGLSWWIRK